MFASTGRRSLSGTVVLALLTAVVVLALPGTASAASSPFGPSFAREFAAPPVDVKPKIRYWWPCGEMTPETIQSEVRQIAGRGFGAAEIACIFSTNPAQYGWGSPALAQRLQEAVEAGRRNGIRIDLTVGPAWPLAVPGLAPDSPAAAKELAYGRAIVTGGETYRGALPAAPEPRPGVIAQSLVAVQAYRCAGDCAAAKPVRLDRGSRIDLTSSVHDGALTWTAPQGGQWLLFSYWQRGTGQASVAGQAVSGDPAFVVDHFAAAGASAATSYLDAHVLTPGTRRLLRGSGGNLFEDSLELDSAQHWTPNLPARFARLRGYSVVDSLPAIFIDRIHRQYTSTTPADTPDFAFTDGSDARIREDYYQTLTDLYVGEHVKPLQAWAHSRGLRYRAQPYGTTIDTSEVAAAVDVPETEPLGYSEPDTDNPFRWVAAGAAHLGGRPMLSFECCALFNAAYGQTWSQVLRQVNNAFSRGVNQVVYHGYATQELPGTPSWPGFSPFTSQGGNGFSEAWGPRQPTWQDTDEVTGWTSRMQYALRQGRPSMDLVVYRQGYDAAVRELTGVAGFTFEFAGPAQLDRTGVRSRRLAPDGPAYRALILDRQPTLPLTTARRLLAHAGSGLPVVVVGNPPSRTPGAYRAAEQDAQLVGVMKQLLAQPAVRQVPDVVGVATALQGLGVRPAAEARNATGLRSVRRQLPGGDIYDLYNPTSATISTEVSLEGRGQPHTLNAWTGRISRLAQFRTEATRTTVPVRLAPGASTLIALGGDVGPHVNAASVGEIVARGGVPVLRATEGGTSTVVLDDGRQVRVHVPAVGGQQSPNTWSLSVADWHRGPDGTLEVSRHQRRLDELRPWSETAGLEDVSGIATYTTTVRLDRLDGAYLELGQVTDTFEVAVNGRKLPAADQISGRLDLAGYVHNGANSLTIRVATPLRNRLRVTEGFPGQTAQPRQQYGLMGPVRIIPYREIPIGG